MSTRAISLCALLALSVTIAGVAAQNYIASSNCPDGQQCLDITNPTILTDENDWAGVHLSADKLADDFERVTSTRATVQNYTGSAVTGPVIIVGSISNSSLVQGLNASGDIEGQWETFVSGVVDSPIDGVDQALVIAGSDKRGTIYGIYTLSEDIGVSPWYWWADVAPKRQDTLYALPAQTTQGPPSVKYRGIFLNDEAPGLTSWAEDTLGSKYTAPFYEHLFELLLRLKANYLWPAMWPAYPEPGDSFFEDDPLNQFLADRWGVVVSTSHQEPMQRATNEWLVRPQDGEWAWEENKDNMTQFMREGAQRAFDCGPCEGYFTIGIRGPTDGPLEGDDPLAITQEVIGVQRSIFKDVYGSEDGVSQVWALYKEVAELYEAGLEVPDDVTMLVSDDNFGNVRRFPNETERERAGGFGLYYHLEYVGTPLPNKWTNTNSLGKAYQQLSLSYATGLDRIWVINVGDLKPMEVPLSMIMSMAWNASSVSPSSIPSQLRQWAQKQFPEEYAEEVGDLLLGHSRLSGVRRHDALIPGVLSHISYNEADRIVEAWHNLSDRAQGIYDALEDEHLPAFYELVLWPIQSSYVFIRAQAQLARNQLWAQEKRTGANNVAWEVLDLFDQDYELQLGYHGLLDGKWDRIVRQPHFGVKQGSFQTPTRDSITGLSFVQLKQKSSPAVGSMGVSVEGTGLVRPGFWNEGSDLSKPSRNDLVPGLTLQAIDTYGSGQRWFEVWHRGGQDEVFDFTVTIPEEAQDWLNVNSSGGTLGADDGWTHRVVLTVDFANVPEGFNDTMLVHVNGTDADNSYEQVHVPVLHTGNVQGGFEGYVEGDGVVSIDASQWQDVSGEDDWVVYPYLGRILESSGVVAPQAASNDSGDGPWIQWSYFQFSEFSEQGVNATLEFTAALDTDPRNPLLFAVQQDGEDVSGGETRLMADVGSPGDLPDGWTDLVIEQVWVHTVPLKGGSGEHTLKYWANRPGVVLERILIDFGGVQECLLGPPFSRIVR